jgi:hypothetical protein
MRIGAIPISNSLERSIAARFAGADRRVPGAPFTKER